MLDIFKTDAFGVTKLTDAILKAPYKPGRLGELRLFAESGIATTQIAVEEKAGVLTLIPTSAYGSPADQLGRQARKLIPILVPHLARESTIYAAEVQGVRAFGSEDQTEVVQTVVNERLATLRAHHEVTLEYHRVGAVQGKILDADGVTTVLNLYTALGVTEQEVDFDLTDANADIRATCVEVSRAIEDELGAERHSGVRVLCSSGFFDALIGHAIVKESFKYQEGQVLRADLRSGFTFGGLTFEEYRGNVGGVPFVPANEARAFPEGTGIFKTYFAPADFAETVQTIGLPIYAKQAPDPEFNRWVKLHTQSNPLAICLRPRACIKLTITP